MAGYRKNFTLLNLHETKTTPQNFGLSATCNLISVNTCQISTQNYSNAACCFINKIMGTPIEIQRGFMCSVSHPSPPLYFSPFHPKSDLRCVKIVNQVTSLSFRWYSFENRAANCVGTPKLLVAVETVLTYSQGQICPCASHDRTARLMLKLGTR
jgi:hypothetical protein